MCFCYHCTIIMRKLLCALTGAPHSTFSPRGPIRRTVPERASAPRSDSCWVVSCVGAWPAQGTSLGGPAGHGRPARKGLDEACAELCKACLLSPPVTRMSRKDSHRA